MMMQSQWTTAIVFGGIVLIGGAAWSLYAEGFTWRVATIGVMGVLIIAGRLRERRKLPADSE